MKKTLCVTLVIIFLSMLLGTCGTFLKFATLIVDNTTNYPISLSFDGTEKHFEALEKDSWAVSWTFDTYDGRLRRTSDLKIIKEITLNHEDESIYQYLGTE